MKFPDIQLPKGYTHVYNSSELFTLIKNMLDANAVACRRSPSKVSYPKPDEYPCIAKLYLDALDIINIDYIPISLINGMNTDSVTPTEIIPAGYCILMQDSIFGNPVTTKQFCGLGSIASIMNRAFDCITIFDALENKYQWHLASAIPLTEVDLKEFESIHIPKV